ncbi:MAG: zinc-ribbon domain-containing protein [Spirulinaceae cyanobacterium]
MITCPNCQHQNADTASFCSNCGNTLSVNTTATSDAMPQPGRPTTEEAPTAVVSPQSPPPQAPSTPVVAAATPALDTPASTRSNNTNWALVAGIAGACVVASVGIIAVALTRSPAPAPTNVESDEAPEPAAAEEEATATIEVEKNAEAGVEVEKTTTAPTSQPDITSVNASVWKVVDTEGLNCRQGAGSNYGVSTTLNPGKEFQVDPGYDNPLVYDNQGAPWLAIVLPGVNCFVRANTAYLQALPNKNAPAGTQAPEGICPDSTVALNQLESANFDVYICGNPSNGLPTHYSGFAKNGSGGITVPFSGLDEGGYYARNGDVLYHIDTVDMKLHVEVPGQERVTESLAWVY